MSTSLNFDELDVMLETESEEQKLARLNRLRAAEIKRRFADIDRARIRALAAVALDSEAVADRVKLVELEKEAQALREELAGLEVT